MTRPALPRPLVLSAAALALLLLGSLAMPASARDAHCAGHSAVWVAPIVAPPFPPVPPIPLVVAAVSHSHGSHGSTAEWTAADGFAWALVGGDDSCMSDGLDSDARESLEEAARDNGGRVLWFRLDGDEWLVRDRGLIARADAALDSMREQGRRMGALGHEQGRLGSTEGRLGAWQGRYGADLSRLAVRRAALEMRLAAARMADDEVGLSPDEARDLERQARDLEREQRALEQRYHKPNEDAMSDLNRQMGELGRQMGEMGRRMGELSKRAERDMRALARESIATHKAQRFGRVEM